jgi:hypothetical protein
MAWTDRLKPVVAKAHESILVGNDKLAYLTQFDLLADGIEPLAFGKAGKMPLRSHFCKVLTDLPISFPNCFGEYVCSMNRV